MKVELADGWKTVHKRWSTWLTLVGSSITSLIVLFPDNSYAAWLALPDDVRHIIPEKYLPLVGAIICLTAIAAKYIKQQKLANADAQQK